MSEAQEIRMVNLWSFNPEPKVKVCKFNLFLYSSICWWEHTTKPLIHTKALYTIVWTTYGAHTKVFHLKYFSLFHQLWFSLSKFVYFLLKKVLAHIHYKITLGILRNIFGFQKKNYLLMFISFLSLYTVRNKNVYND